MTTMTTPKPAPPKKGASAPASPEPISDEELARQEAEQQAKAEYNRLMASMSPDEPVYIAGNRAPRLKVGGYTLKPGDVVPGAHNWPRREAYERLGRIERA